MLVKMTLTFQFRRTAAAPRTVDVSPVQLKSDTRLHGLVDDGSRLSKYFATALRAKPLSFPKCGTVSHCGFGAQFLENLLQRIQQDFEEFYGLILILVLNTMLV